jgi:hypothetical protein
MTTAIEARVQRIEDELAILRIMLDYSAFLDARDYDSYVGLFAPDGEWSNAEGSYKGHAAIHAMLLRLIGPSDGPAPPSYHLNSNPRIDIDGDHATGFIRYLYMTRGPDGRPQASLAGLYHDEFIRLDGKWKIARRAAGEIIPTQAEWRSNNPLLGSD